MNRLPLIMYHQIQLLACAVLARHYGASATVTSTARSTEGSLSCGARRPPRHGIAGDGTALTVQQH